MLVPARDRKGQPAGGAFRVSGVCKGFQGDRGPQGLQGERGPQGSAGLVRSDWAAMALAATGIRYTDDARSIGLGLGNADGTSALAAGIRFDLPSTRLHGAVMHSLDGETGVSVGIAWGW